MVSSHRPRAKVRFIDGHRNCRTGSQTVEVLQVRNATPIVMLTGYPIPVNGYTGPNERLARTYPRLSAETEHV
jgi:hypothetical protein